MEKTGTKNHSDDSKDCDKLHLDDPFSLFLDKLHLPPCTALNLRWKRKFGEYCSHMTNTRKHSYPAYCSSLAEAETR